MSLYEFSLRQEVLSEKGASVLGQYYRYERDNCISDARDPIMIMHSLVWNAKQDILLARTEQELDRIDGQFDLANKLITNSGCSAHA